MKNIEIAEELVRMRDKLQRIGADLLARSNEPTEPPLPWWCVPTLDTETTVVAYWRVDADSQRIVVYKDGTSDKSSHSLDAIERNLASGEWLRVSQSDAEARVRKPMKITTKHPWVSVFVNRTNGRVQNVGGLAETPEEALWGYENGPATEVVIPVDIRPLLEGLDLNAAIVEEATWKRRWQ